MKSERLMGVPKNSNVLYQLMDSDVPTSGLTDGLIDFIKVIDADGVVQYASPHSKSLLGWDSDVGNSIFEHVHPDDVERSRQALYDLLQNRCSVRLECLYQHADGHYIHFETNANPLCKGKKIVGAILFCRDITERVLREKAQSYSQDMYAKVFRLNPDPITISTVSDGRYVDVNNAFTRYMEYTREEIVGKTADQLGIWANPEDRWQVIARIKNNGQVEDLEMQFISKSGNIMTGLLSINIIEINNEPHLLSVIKDITVRKQLERSLSLLEEFFSKAFNASPIIMAVSLLEESTCIDINESFSRIIGYKREEVLGQSLLELGIWADPGERLIMKHELLQGRGVREMETSFVTKSGSLRSGLYSAERIDIDGQAYVLSILVDMTERKQMEREIARLDQMNLVGQIAVSIGHEVRNPMTTIRGYLQLLRLKKKYAGEYETLDLMIQEIDRANSIISDFISLANDKYVELKPLDLNMILTGLLPWLNRAADLQDKIIEWGLEALPLLPMDEKEIQKLIINLVQNGLEAMKPGGTLRITTLMQGHEVALVVEDEGSGMSDEVQDKLGTPFFTTKRDGTGLGLAVCNGIARRHNAVIKYSSGQAGTTVKVMFPFQTLP